MDTQQWWVFDRPVWRDAVFLATAVLAVVGAIGGAALAPGTRVLTLVYFVLGGLVASWFVAAIVLGAVRNAVRAYREDEPRSGSTPP